MVDLDPGFETVDNSGSTDHFNGSVTTVINIPSVADKVISEVFIQNISTPASSVLQVSFNGGAGFTRISRNGHFAWTPKGQNSRQIQIKSLTAASVSYEIIINFEEY